MPCEDPRCDCHQANRDRKTTSGNLVQSAPITAINVAHGALGDAAGLASRVRNLVETLLGPAGPTEGVQAQDKPPAGVLPGLADHAIATADSIRSAQIALDRLETHTLS